MSRRHIPQGQHRVTCWCGQKHTNAELGRRGYYAPMSARRLERYAFRRLVPFWIRWLFGWR